MPPSLKDVVEAIAQTEPLDQAQAKLGVPRESIIAMLRYGAALEASAIQASTALGTSGSAVARERASVSGRDRAAPSVQPERSRGPKPLPAPMHRALLYCDGASRGNPGPAGAGAVLVLPDGRSFRLGKFLGVQTNNVAEYQGVLLGLEKALDLGVKTLDVRADSMLAVMQLNGAWRLKNEGLRPLFERARQLVNRFDDVTFQHVPREQNQAADEMSNRAIDERM